MFEYMLVDRIQISVRVNHIDRIKWFSNSIIESRPKSREDHTFIYFPVKVERYFVSQFYSKLVAFWELIFMINRNVEVFCFPEK